MRANAQKASLTGASPQHGDNSLQRAAQNCEGGWKKEGGGESLCSI